MPVAERATVAFFGIRGMGSIYYVAWALGEHDLADGPLLWATVLFVVLLSIAVHGVAASPVMERLRQKGRPPG
jgi:NhaP-type Na+/H+ or K+/H+ antiporter